MSPNIEEILLIRRPCLTISNLERSLTLYQDILGFKLTYSSKASSDSYLYSLFNLPPEAEITFASLDSPHEPRVLALTEVKGIKLSPPNMSYSCALVIQVNQLKNKIEQVKKLNLEVIKPNTFTTENNLNFTEQTFRDFDGHPLLLYEQSPIML